MRQTSSLPPSSNTVCGSPSPSCLSLHAHVHTRARHAHCRRYLCATHCPHPGISEDTWARERAPCDVTSADRRESQSRSLYVMSVGFIKFNYATFARSGSRPREIFAVSTTHANYLLGQGQRETYLFLIDSS